MLSRPATGTTRKSVTVGVALGLTEVIDMVLATEKLKGSQRFAGDMGAHHIAIGLAVLRKRKQAAAALNEASPRR
jgi:hypothetical protein